MKMILPNRNGDLTADKFLIHEKNMFDMSGLKAGVLSTADGVTIATSGSPTIALTDGDYIYNASSTSATVGFHNEKYIAVEPETEYTFSRDWGVLYSRHVRFVYYDVDKSYISASSTTNSDANVIQLTTPANCKYMRMTCYNIYSMPVTIGQTMVEVGHYNSQALGNPPIATTYEPFVQFRGYKSAYETKLPNIYDTVFAEILEQQTFIAANSTLKAMFETYNEATDYIDWTGLGSLQGEVRTDGEELIIKSAPDKTHLILYPGITLDNSDVYYVRAEVKRLDEELVAFFSSFDGGSSQIATLQTDLDTFNILGGKATGDGTILRFSHQSNVGNPGAFESSWKNFVVLNLTDTSLTILGESFIEEKYLEYRKYKYPNLLTGSEIITDYIGRKIYVDYDNDIAHNLTTIYGSGNEPSLATHESLIPQYTDTVIKAPAFKNDLQSELMSVSVNDKVSGDLSFADFIANYQLVANGDFSDGTSGWSAFNANLSIVDNHLEIDSLGTAQIYQLFTMPNATKYYSIITYQRSFDNGTPRVVGYGFSQTFLTVTDDLNLNTFSGVFTTTGERTGIAFYPYVGSGNYANVYKFFLFNITALQTLQLYSPLYDDTFDNLSDAQIKAQMDLWVEIYSVLSGNTTKTGTVFLGGRYYVDYDNLKVYDYSKAEPYIPSTPADKEAYMEDLLDKTVVLNWPIKARIRSDGITILGDYIVIGES